MVLISASRAERDIEDAAQIWAEATSFRDGAAEVPGLAMSLPVIESVLHGSSLAFLLIARAPGGTACGFAAVRPLPDAAAEERGDGEPDQEAGPGAEIAYFGVRPGEWGQGIGEELLRAAALHLAAAGFSRAELSVYAENARAVALYHRLGWQPAGDATPHPRTGKPEQRYELDLRRPQ